MGAMVWEVTPDYPGGHIRPMTAAEVKQLQIDQAAAAVSAQAQEATDAAQVALAAKLAAGTASTAEVQAALANLIG